MGDDYFSYVDHIFRLTEACGGMQWAYLSPIAFDIFLLY